MRKPILAVLFALTLFTTVVCACSSEQTETSERSEINYVTRDNTPVYTEPDDTSSCIAYVDEDDFVLVMSDYGVFSKVKTSSSQVGYINRRYLTPDEPSGEEGRSTEAALSTDGENVTKETEGSIQETMPEPQKIKCSAVNASDYHTDSRDGTEYFGDLAVDGDLNTAWNVRGGDTNDDPNTNGVGQYIDFIFPEGTKLSSVTICPGYLSDAKSFKNNYVPTVLILSTGDRQFRAELGEYATDFKKATKGYTYSFGDEWLELEDGVLTITIDSVWSKNKKWQDCCIAEVKFYGEPGEQG